MNNKFDQVIKAGFFFVVIIIIIDFIIQAFFTHAILWVFFYIVSGNGIAAYNKA